MRISGNPTWLLLSLGAFLVACPGDDKDDTDDPIVEDDTAEDTDGTDQDGDGYNSDEDCDDLDASVYPGADEECDGIDNDCDGEIDEGVTDIYYYDGDGDGFGDPENSTEACEALTDYVPNSNDCDDSDASIYPDAEELCDGLDNDCDGDVDEDLTSATWYADNDGDGYGDPDATQDACEQPTGFVDNDYDCDDGDSGEPVHVSETGATWSKGSKSLDSGVIDSGAGETGAPSGAGTVDDPFDWIQEGIDAANVCVFVFAGTYEENIDFNGKDILVWGVDGAENTTIDGTGDGPTVTFENGESSDAILNGFTITGGTGEASEDSATIDCGSAETCTTYTYTYAGGGIYVNSASPTLQSLIVSDNTLPDYSYTELSDTEDSYVYSYGGGAWFGSSSSVLTDVWFVDNSADEGGGIYVDDGSSIDLTHSGFNGNSAATGGGASAGGALTMLNSVFVNNSTADSGDSYGGAAVDVGTGLFYSTNLTLVGNDGMASLYIGTSGTSTVINTILAENADGYVIDGDSGNTLSITYSDVYSSGGMGYGSGVTDATGADGNIDDDPTFTAWSDDDDYSNDDLSLGSGSPAIDAGSTASVYDDVDGTTNDMGAWGGPQGDW